MSPIARLLLAFALSVAAAAFAVKAEMPLSDQCEPDGWLAAARAAIFPNVLHHAREAVVRQADAESRFAESVLEQERKKIQFCTQHPGLCGPSQGGARVPDTRTVRSLPLVVPGQAIPDAARLQVACRLAVGSATGDAVQPASRHR